MQRRVLLFGYFLKKFISQNNIERLNTVLKSWRFIQIFLNTVFYFKNKVNNIHSA